MIAVELGPHVDSNRHLDVDEIPGTTSWPVGGSVVIDLGLAATVSDRTLATAAVAARAQQIARLGLRGQDGALVEDAYARLLELAHYGVSLEDLPPQPHKAGTPVSRDEVSVDPARLTWRSLADQGIEQLAATGWEFSAFDLLTIGVPEPPSAAMWGPRFAAAARRRRIVRTRYGPSRRPTVSGSAVTYWRGVA